MYRTLLVPVDGAAHAESAIPFALALAGPGAAVHLAHVHEPPTPVLIEGVPIADPSLDVTVRDHETAYLTGLLARVKAAAPAVTADVRTLDTDDPLADALARAAADTHAELVVMTTHGRGPLGRFLLGSVADDTVVASPAPVLVVRASGDAAPDLGTRPAVREVVVPLDGTPFAEAILGPAEKLAVAAGAGLTLMTAGAGASHDYLDGVARRVGGPGTVVRTWVVPGTDPAAAILAHANGTPGAVVAIPTHGRTGLSRLIRGSVAEAVVHGATGPVLVFHPAG